MKLNLSKKNLILIPLVIIVSVLAIGLLIPIFMPDGTEKFQGEEKVAAEEALKEMEDLEPNLEKVLALLDGDLKLRVEDVFSIETPTTGIHKNCKKLYRTTFSSWTYFGFQIETSESKFSENYGRTVCLEYEIIEENSYSR